MAINQSLETRPFFPRIHPEFQFSSVGRTPRPEYTQVNPNNIQFKHFDLRLPYSEVALHNVVKNWGDKHEYWVLRDGSKKSPQELNSHSPTSQIEQIHKKTYDLYSYGKLVAKVSFCSTSDAPRAELLVLADINQGFEDPNLVLFSKLMEEQRAFHAGYVERKETELQRAIEENRRTQHPATSTSESQLVLAGED